MPAWQWLTVFVGGAFFGAGICYVWASLQLAKRDPPHGLDDEALAARAQIAEHQRMDPSKAGNREARKAQAVCPFGGPKPCSLPSCQAGQPCYAEVV